MIYRCIYINISCQYPLCFFCVRVRFVKGVRGMAMTNMTSIVTPHHRRLTASLALASELAKSVPQIPHECNKVQQKNWLVANLPL